MSRQDSEDSEIQQFETRRRVISVHRNVTFRQDSQSSNVDERRWIYGSISLEDYALDIAQKLKEDEKLVKDSQLKMETLKNLPQCLALRRMVKKQLDLSAPASYKSIGCFKRFKYFLSLKFALILYSLKSYTYTFELWYKTLKTIEGHFGTGVGAYFHFLRWIFILNCICILLIMGFIVVPQVLFSYLIQLEDPKKIDIFDDDGSILKPEESLWRWIYVGDKFKWNNLLNGEGFLTNTSLYYGFYTNESIQVFGEWQYNMPQAYFFTMFFLYFVIFAVLSATMAKSYRRSFIETQGGLKNIYAHKIFCGWDFSIASEQAAELKSTSIYGDLKELLSDVNKQRRKTTLGRRVWIQSLQIFIHFFIILMLYGIGYGIWKLLEIENKDSSWDISLIRAFVINLIMALLPLCFTLIVKQEDYKDPRRALHVTLFRVFLLEMTIVGVLVSFWLTHAKKHSCWETSLGQEIYRLTIFEFFFSTIVTPVVLFVRYCIFLYITKKINLPEFDIARYTLQLIYNQTLMWMGLIFSPLLLIVVIIKLWMLWYARSICLLKFCKPCSKSWRPVQTHTLFLIYTFLSLLMILSVHGYIIVNIEASHYGPFRDYSYIYQMVTKGILKLEQSSAVWKMFMYLTKPGAVTLLLIAISICVYYLRTKALAEKAKVMALREMLKWEAKDKDFLLNYIQEVKKLESTSLTESSNGD